MYKIYGNFQPYTPERTEHNSAFIDTGAGFLKDSDGRDWYELSKELADNKAENQKFLLLTSDDIVLCVSQDPTAYFPYGMKIVVIDNLTVNLDPKLGYIKFTNGEFVDYNKEAVEQAQSIVETEMMWASNQISTLEDMISMGLGTESRKKYLEKLKEYRIKLFSLDPEEDMDISLPDRPSKK